MNSAPEVRLFVARLAPSWLARDLTIRMAEVHRLFWREQNVVHHFGMDDAPGLRRLEVAADFAQVGAEIDFLQIGIVREAGI
jgi:hypothetical protein